MKKFLLLLVGVLFALSAKAANYTFYIDIQNTGWNSAPYVYCANTSKEYYSQFQANATPVKGSIYKITFSWNNLKYVAFSSQSGLIKDKALNVSSTDWGQTIYGELDGNDNSDHRIESGALYVLNPNNGSTIDEKNKFAVTSNYDPNATDPDPDPTPSGDVPSLSGNYCFFLNTSSWTEPHVYVWNGNNNNNWNNVGGDKMTQYSGNLYYWQSSNSWTPASIIISDKGSNNSNSRFEKPYTNGAVYNPNGSTVDAEKTTYYFDVAGSEITTTPSLSIGWATVEGTLTKKTGVYSFTIETAIPAEYWVIKFTDGTNNYTSTALTADHVYKYESTEVADKGLYSDYTPVVVTPEHFTIYFDAVRSGGAAVSLAVDGEPTVTETTVEINNHNIYQYDFEVVAGTKATFTYNGIALDKFTPETGQVYYYDGSAQDSEAYDGYSWAPATSEYKDMEIAISGNFLDPSWAAPGTSNAAPRFVWQEGSTFTLDLSGYTFETSTSFKIFNVTGDLKGTHNNYGDGYGSNGNAVTLGTTYTLARTDATNANLTVSAKVVNPQITLDASNWTITIKAKEVETNNDYYIHGKVLGDGSWTAYKMTAQADGTWTYTSDKFTPTRRFGIRQTDHNKSSQTAWIYNNGKTGEEKIDDGQGVPVSLGVQYSCVVEKNSNGINWGTDANFSTGTTYTLVFDPNKNTIVFINPTAVEAAVSAEAVTIGNSKANNLNVNVKVADYYKGAAVTSYTLSNGSYSATSNDGNFTNVPYATDYTLTPGTGAAMPINITMPTTTFEISQTEKLVAPAADSKTGKASLVVYFKATCAWLYNLPQIVCTSGSETISGEVVWKSNAVGDGDYDFAFIANDVVAYADGYATESKTFYFVVTPVYPFAVVAPATPAPSKMRAPASAFQYITGAAVAGKTVEITPTSPVSGIEGVVIEAEDAPVEYFNLQGQRVNGDLAPGIYIRRQGATVTKVRI